jgi:hypothetical protein
MKHYFISFQIIGSFSLHEKGIVFKKRENALLYFKNKLESSKEQLPWIFVPINGNDSHSIADIVINDLTRYDSVSFDNGNIYIKGNIIPVDVVD